MLETRQVIIWKAEVRKSSEGTTLAGFLAAMTRRLRWRARSLDKADAYTIAIDVLKSLDVEFGDPDWDWSRASARDIAEEEMSYWDDEGAEGNN